MHALIIIGGYAPETFGYALDYDRIIAADSGYDTARRLGLNPDLIVGDLDSTSYESEILMKNCKRVPKDKDETDTEIAIAEAGCEYDLLGGGEGRIDHTLSIIALFKKYGYPRYWFTRVDTLISIDKETHISLPKDTELSLLSPFGSIVTTSGLVWDIDHRILDSTFLSLSNRMKENKARLVCSSPILLRLDPKDFAKLEVLK